MCEIKARHIVQCKRLGSGDFKVIDIRGTGSNREARIQNVNNSKDIHWVYVSHLSVDKSSRQKNLANRYDEANKILNKKKR